MALPDFRKGFNITLTKLQMVALENTCYVLGAGAFAVFVRWLQVTAGTNDEGLFNKTVWNVLVPLCIFVSLAIFFNMTRKLKKKRYYIDENPAVALKNTGKLYGALRILIGGTMAVGGVLLILACETDKHSVLQAIVGGLGVVSGTSFIWLLGAYNREDNNPNLLCLAASAPLLLFAVWIITTYKENDINSVVWAYGVEIVAMCVVLVAFFRLAGFAFGVVDFNHVHNTTMLGIFMLMLSLADERYLGQQVMIIGGLCMLLYYDWLILTNMQQGEAPLSYQPTDGFERL